MSRNLRNRPAEDGVRQLDGKATGLVLVAVVGVMIISAVWRPGAVIWFGLSAAIGAVLAWRHPQAAALPTNAGRIGTSVSGIRERIQRVFAVMAFSLGLFFVLVGCHLAGIF
jgi:hypothetical protein